MQEKQEETQENEGQGEHEVPNEAEEKISPIEQPDSDFQDEEDDEKLEYSEEEEEIGGKLIQGGGCLRGCLTPVIIIFGIILILILAVYMKRDSIDDMLIRRILTNTQKHVLMVLPEDMGMDEIEPIFNNVRTALKEKKVDEENLARVISEYHDAMKKDISERRKREEIDKLIKGLNDSIITSGQP